MQQEVIGVEIKGQMNEETGNEKINSELILTQEVCFEREFCFHRQKW
jgi:hypothetical protein